MPNRHHTERDCDEDCRCCWECYMATGDPWQCTRLCPHAPLTHPEDFEDEEDECHSTTA